MINSRFKIIKKLGEGRNKVFLCSDSFYDKQFAMKVIPKNADEEELEAFRKEFFILTNFTSNNIVKAYERNVVLEIDENEDNEFGIDLDSKFIILEFIDIYIIFHIIRDQEKGLSFMVCFTSEYS